MKRLIALVLGLVLNFSLSTNLYAKDLYRVGFAQDTMGNDWREAQVKELEAQLKPHTNIQFFYTDGKASTTMQIIHVEDMIKNNVDIIISSPSNATAMTPVIEKAYKKGIPVVLLSRTINSDQYTSFAHPDNTLIAQQAAKFIIKKLNKQGNVLVLEGVPGATSSINRTKGFMRIVGQISEIKTTRVVGNYLRSDALFAVEKLIKDGYEFDAIYAQSDSMAIGAILALKKHGYNTKDIIIVGIDFISDAVELIKSGDMDATYIYPTGAKQGAEVVLKIIKGEEVAKEIIIESTEVTIDNIDKVKPIF